MCFVPVLSQRVTANPVHLLYISTLHLRFEAGVLYPLHGRAI